jgi:hypothetical protein
MYGEITEESKTLRTEYKMHTGRILLPKEWDNLKHCYMVLCRGTELA